LAAAIVSFHLILLRLFSFILQVRNCLDEIAERRNKIDFTEDLYSVYYHRLFEIMKDFGTHDRQADVAWTKARKVWAKQASSKG
jgi:hypothetical protein